VQLIPKTKKELRRLNRLIRKKRKAALYSKEKRWAVLIAFFLGFFVNYVMGNLLDRITVDSNICHGKACIRHMRWPVEVIIDLIASGMSFDDILNDHPELEKEDILASLSYAKISLSGKSLEEVR
jgi:uncharacterized protein (DUF433 family)